MKIMNIMDRIGVALEQRKIARALEKVAKKYPHQQYVIAIIDEQANTTTGMSNGIISGLALTAVLALIREIGAAVGKSAQEVLNDLRMCDAKAEELRERLQETLTAPKERREEILKEIEKEIGEAGVKALYNKAIDDIKIEEDQ